MSYYQDRQQVCGVVPDSVTEKSITEVYENPVLMNVTNEAVGSQCTMYGAL